MVGGLGSVSHAKRHLISSLKDHKPVPGAVPDDIVVFDANGLPVKDGGVTIAALVSGLIPRGNWNAFANTSPDGPLASGVGTSGYFYYVSVAGTTMLDGINDWEFGDIVFFDGVSSKWRKIDNTDRATYVYAAQWYWVSQLKGDDTLGDGSLFNPFKTMQKAVNAGVAAGLNTIDVICDQTVIAQNVVLPPNQLFNFESPAGPESPPYFATLSISKNTFCNLNSCVVDTLLEVGPPGLRWIWFEEGYLEFPFTMPNTEVRFTSTRMPTAALNASSAAVIQGHVFLSNKSYRFLSGLGANSFNITDVADPINAYDAVNKQYAETNITLAGVAPVDNDMFLQPTGKQAVGVGTGGRIFFMINRGTPAAPIVKCVEMS